MNIIVMIDLSPPTTSMAHEPLDSLPVIALLFDLKHFDEVVLTQSLIKSIAPASLMSGALHLFFSPFSTAPLTGWKNLNIIHCLVGISYINGTCTVSISSFIILIKTNHFRLQHADKNSFGKGFFS